MNYIPVKYKVTRTNMGVTLCVFHKDIDIAIDGDSKNYISVLGILRETGGYLSQDQYDSIFNTNKKSKALKTLAKLGFGYSKDTRTFSSPEGGICFNKEIVDYILKAILDASVSIDSISRVIRFGIKLNNQTSNNIKVNLFKFLLSNSIGFDNNGYVLAYKVVRNNYLDKHTGTIDNSVGTVVEMPRNLVDDRDYETCSHGLHVCALSYVSYFIGSGDRIVTVAIDPEDFVSVPTDYNFAKARVCRYVVLADITNNVNINEDCNYFKKECDDED